jgi:ABC-type sugar transport system substrate-binding protein
VEEREVNVTQSWSRGRRARLAAIGPALLALAVAAAACGDENGSAAGGGAAGAKAGEPIEIGAVFKHSGNVFFAAVEEGARNAAAASPDVNLTVQSPALKPGGDVDPVGQISVVENMLARGIDALVIAPNAPDQLQPVLQRAVDDGVPVVLVDTDIPAFADKTTFIGTDNFDSGKAAGEHIEQQLAGAGTLGVLEGTPGVGAEVDRVRGVEAALEGTDVKVVARGKPSCSRERTVSVVEDMLQAHPDLDALFGPCGAETDMLLEGPPAGITYATVAQRPTEMGERGVESAVKAVRGEQVPKSIETGFTVVTAENAAEWQNFGAGDG